MTAIYEDVATGNGVIWDCLQTEWSMVPDGDYKLRTVCPDYNNPNAQDVDLVWESDLTTISVKNGQINKTQACEAAGHLMDCVGRHQKYLCDVWFDESSNTLQFDIGSVGIA